MAGFTLFGFTHHLLTTSMRLRAARHELLVANVANADTPGYRPRDLDFDGVLRALVLEHRSREASMHSQGLRADSLEPEPLSHKPLAIPHLITPVEREGEEKIDRNRVDLDREIGLLIENSLLHEASLTLLSRKLGGLRYAIGEGRR